MNQESEGWALEEVHPIDTYEREQRLDRAMLPVLIVLSPILLGGLAVLGWWLA